MLAPPPASPKSEHVKYEVSDLEDMAFLPNQKCTSWCVSWDLAMVETRTPEV
jgi:hypothetical protein